MISNDDAVAPALLAAASCWFQCNGPGFHRVFTQNIPFKAIFVGKKRENMGHLLRVPVLRVPVLRVPVLRVPVLLVAAAALATACGTAAAEAPVHIQLEPGKATVVFDGIGGDSGGGGGTRLLLDYDEPARSDILDLLFKPQWGASLHTIKVELGCDGDTTQGAEQSHMHTADDHSPTAFDRGYEIWLLVEARKRNPLIHTSGLEWGVPGWVNEGGYFGEKNTQYMLSWIRGLKERKNLTLDSISLGRNEAGYDVEWIKKTRQAMNDAGFAAVKVIAADDHRGGSPALIEQMINDTALRDAIDIIGVHTMGRLNGVVMPDKSKAQMAAMHKPFWNTEQHFGTHAGEGPDSCRDWATAAELALTLNRLYVQENMTSILMWTPIYSWYEWLWFTGKGLMVANTPWSNHYEVPPTLWVSAMTTQFAQPGDRYMASGMLCAADTCGATSSCNCTGPRCGDGQVPCGSGSYVSYLSADGNDVSIVIETMWKNGSIAGVDGPFDDQPLRFQLGGPLGKAKALHLWVTNATHQFLQVDDVAVGAGGTIEIAVPKNNVYTLTTTTGQRKGGGEDSQQQQGGSTAEDEEERGVVIPPAQNFSSFLPLRYDFEGLPLDSLPRYFSDMQGAFAVATEGGGESASESGGNQVMRQNAPVSPTASEGCGGTAATAIGDNSWGYYNISMRGRTMRAGGKLYLTSHAGTAHHGQMHQAGMEPGDLCSGFGYRLSITCKGKPTPAVAAVTADTSNHVALAAAAATCPANKSNVQCGGLKNDKAGDASAELCGAACCADSASACREWYWRPLLAGQGDAAVAGGCWRGVCVVPPIPSAGWVGGTRGAAAAAAGDVWTLSAKSEGGYTILASGSNVTCEAGEFIDMSVAVVPSRSDNSASSALIVASAGGRELARAPIPSWGFTSGAASVGCSIGIAEFDDIVIEASQRPER
jgi:hypothetical protein